jgi:hypothetical protein
MLTDKKYVIRLNAFDLGQLLDGLEARADAWRNTATYMTTGEAPTDDFLAEECNDAEEAEKLAKHYRRIIAIVMEQRAEQDRS